MLASLVISLHLVSLGLGFQARLDAVTLGNFVGIASLQFFIVEKIKHLISQE